ncbi:MAG: AraC family transcriptional regulator [Opitutaceae bacterium]|nr:AraC family transcriptional regulator [Opitutaceae bacterium]
MPLDPTLSASNVAVLAAAAIDRALLEELFDHTPDIAFFIKDAAGRYTTVNHSLVERHGLRSKAEMIGRRPADVCAGSFGRIPTEQDADVLRTGRPIVEHLELHWLLPHRPVWCLTTKLPLRDAAGKIRGLIGISKDVRAPLPPREIQPEIAAALLHLETNYAEPISPSRLARLARVPPARFGRVVKRIFGLTPVQLIAKTRIAAGSLALRDTPRAVAEIAHACGFSDHSAFTRAFRAATGVTPTEFRRIHGAAPVGGGPEAVRRAARRR